MNAAVGGKCSCPKLPLQSCPRFRFGKLNGPKNASLKWSPRVRRSFDKFKVLKITKTIFGCNSLIKRHSCVIR